MIDPVPEVQPLDVGPLSPPAPPQRNIVYRAFVGPRGLRAGWKVLIFFLIFAGLGVGGRKLVDMAGKIDAHAPLPARHRSAE